MVEGAVEEELDEVERTDAVQFLIQLGTDKVSSGEISPERALELIENLRGMGPKADEFIDEFVTAIGEIEPVEEAVQPMNLAEWRKSRVVDDTLPSGLAVKYKKVSLLDMAAEGLIPETLTKYLENAMSGNQVKFDLKELERLSPALNAVAKASLAYPPVADEADDTHLAVNELPIEDRIYLFERVNKEAVKLRPFRGEKGQPGHAAPNGKGIRPPTKRNNRRK